MTEFSHFPAYVVIGATGGIGAALCRQLAAAGSRLMLVGRSSDRLGSLTTELQSIKAGHYLSFVADATKSSEVDAAFKNAIDAFIKIDGATNLVGSILLKPAHLTSDDEFETTLTLNLRTGFYTLRAAAKTMLATGGSIVLMSTVATQIGLANHEAIAAAKGGINGLVLAGAASYAGRSIRVNGVAPGLVRTPLAAKITSNEMALKASTSMHPLGRIGEPDDVATVIAWLLNPVTSWVTGQIISVDGGMSTVKGK